MFGNDVDKPVFKFIGWMLLALLLIVCGGIIKLLFSAEPSRVVYDSRTLPGLYQDGSLAGYPQLYNPSVTRPDGSKAHPHGTPNNHFPWLAPGGVPADQQVATLKELELPASSKIKVWVERGTLPTNYIAPDRLYRWSFPVGTIARVRLFDGSREFARHVSTKQRDGLGIDCWDGEEQIVGELPRWYQSPANCTDCHSDIGKHARVLRPRDENYYHWLRGSDGRFSWHPFVPLDPRSMTSQPLRILDQPFVEFVK